MPTDPARKPSPDDSTDRREIEAMAANLSRLVDQQEQEAKRLRTLYEQTMHQVADSRGLLERIRQQLHGD